MSKNATFEPPKERVFTNTASVSSLIDPKDDPVNETTRLAKEKTQRALQLSRKEAPLPESTGLMAVSASYKAIHEKIQLERKKAAEQIRFVMKQTLQMIEAQIAEIDRQIKRNTDQISKNNERIEQLRQEIQTTADLQDKIRKDGYDPNDPEQARMLKTLGIDPRRLEGKSQDEIDVYLETLRLAQIHELNALSGENDRLRKENDQLQKERDRLEKALGPSRKQTQEFESKTAELAAKSESLEERSAKCQSAEEFERLKQERLRVLGEMKSIESNANELREERKRTIAYKNKDLSNEQIDLQESHSELEVQKSFKDYEVVDEKFLSPESEIEHFMKELAKSQTIEGKMEKLAREKELVSALSPEAADQLSLDEHTEEMFKPDYFKPLERASASLAKSLPALTTNLSLG